MICIEPWHDGYYVTSCSRVRLNHSLWAGHEGRENDVAIAANPNTLANEVVTGKLAEQIIWGKGTLTLPKKKGGR